MPNACVPAAAPGLPSSSRRRLLLGAAAASIPIVTPVAALEPHPDAALLAHLPTVATALAVAHPLRFELLRLYEIAETNPAAQDAADAIYDRWSAALEACHPACEALVGMPAHTVEGACFKALVTIVSTCGGSIDDDLIESVLTDLVAIEAARVSA